MRLDKRYSGQALAIVMIVLVVAAVIGMAMMSRTLRDQARTVQEQTSAEAIEYADSVIDVVKGTSVAELSDTCKDPKYGRGLNSEDGCVVEGVAGIKDFFGDIGVSEKVLNSFDGCQNRGSDVGMDIELATVEDELEVRSGAVRSYVLAGEVPSPAACTLDMNLESRSGDKVGFMVTYIYGRNYTNGLAGAFKPYEYDDTVFYCIDNGTGCPDGSVLSGAWARYDPDSLLSLSLADKGGYQLDEVRIRPVNGTVAIKSELSSAGCIPDTEMVKITVAANCAGSYRGESLQLPQQDWGLPIFDYVVFNGNGVLQPE